MSIDISQAASSIKKIYNESSSLSPNSLITLFEIEVSPLANDLGITTGNTDSVFRFHNNIQLTTNKIYFQDKEYIAAPIQAEGFEINAKGTLPVPKLSITVHEEGIALNLVGLFKEKLRQLGDLVGAKVTRIRTFAKYLDIKNWPADAVPVDIDPDPYAEFPRDVYYIDRKSNENKLTLEYQLASSLDIEGIKLPARIISAKRCPAMYRGMVCCYEYANRKNYDIHENATLPFAAPPVANDRDELISDVINGAPLRPSEAYFARKLSTYRVGSVVYLTKNGLNYYFVCKQDSPLAGPPNTNYWVADLCSKNLVGCRMRWGTNGAVEPGTTGLVKGQLPFNGFPGVDRIK